MSRPTDSTESGIDAFLAREQSTKVIRVVVCGSIDDGKSTLLGYLMSALDARYNEIESADLAGLLDSLSAEREQNITIDVAYRHIRAGNRRYIFADSPGHQQFSANMATACSTADIAVLLVDVTKGIQPQTRVHAAIVGMMQTSEVVCLVNKMDAVSFAEEEFRRVAHEVHQLAVAIGLRHIASIPVSALVGENVIRPSANMPWYTGVPFIDYLNNWSREKNQPDDPIFAVQRIVRDQDAARGLLGKVDGGDFSVGDLVKVTASGEAAVIEKITRGWESVSRATNHSSVGLWLDRNLDIGRGDALSLAKMPLGTTNKIRARLLWLDEEPCSVGRTYDVKWASFWTACSIESIEHDDALGLGASEGEYTLSRGGLRMCEIALSSPIPYVEHSKHPGLGNFILVDRLTRRTFAAGTIIQKLAKSANVYKQPLSIARLDRERLNGQHGRVVWITGLSGSGKSTLANLIERELHQRGHRSYLLDGDNIRKGLCSDLGFSDAERMENVRRLAEDAGLVVLVAAVSPFQHDRDMARGIIGDRDFFELHVSTPLEVCEERDPKGLYRRARAGQLANFTGVSSPYEAPRRPSAVVDCTSPITPGQICALIEQLSI
ncbi:adenylyl-sulfate kinase [Sinorhizobium meliloti]|uniref:adenylyl-sulfate kinase n=1 Tax=Rhizobium meliloti TaxID=382 RepID=UPI002074851C|nr:adenylyl-sulfate kinase [Sinorhizobium meliloti]MCM5693033.1 adenylyl-sulfate kinase [Sinorhizobium meliloti]